MYVYYEHHVFYTGSRNYEGRAIYTHQITVHENQSPEQYEALRSKYCQHKVSYSKAARRVYVRVLARRAKWNKMKPEHPWFKRSGQTHWAEVRNYLLNINYRIDYDEDGTKVFSDILD